MNKFSVLLVEDSPSFALEVEMLLMEMGHDLLPVVDNATDALAAISQKRPDLILLDIELRGGLSGLDFANSIKHLPIPIIFTTSSNDQETYERAKKANVIGYLVKPFDRLSLQAAIETSMMAWQPSQSKPAVNKPVPTRPDTENFFLVKQNGLLNKVYFKEILFLQADGNYTNLVTAVRRFVVKNSMKNMASQLSGDFVRIHRRHVVRFDAISSIDVNNEVVLIGEVKLPLGRKYKATLLERFQLVK